MGREKIWREMLCKIDEKRKNLERNIVIAMGRGIPPTSPHLVFIDSFCE